MVWILLVFAVVTTLTTAALAVLLWQSRQALQALSATATGTAELLRDFATNQSQVLLDLRHLIVHGVESLPDALTERLDAERMRFPTGAFLPTDEDAAAQEKLLRAVEDHFVGSEGQARFSPLTSQRSRSSAATGRSTRRAPPSGTR